MVVMFKHICKYYSTATENPSSRAQIPFINPCHQALKGIISQKTSASHIFPFSFFCENKTKIIVASAGVSQGLLSCNQTKILQKTQLQHSEGSLVGLAEPTSTP